MKKVFDAAIYVIALAIVLSALVTGALSEGNVNYYVEPQYGLVVMDQVFVKAEANSASAKVAKLTRGNFVVILGRSEGYYLVSGEGITNGYVEVGDLYMGLPQYVTVLADGRAKTAPSDGAYSAYSLKAGDELKVVETIMVGSEIWYSVLDNDHGIGMVKATSVTTPVAKNQDADKLNAFKVGNNQPVEIPFEEEELLDDEIPEEVPQQQETANNVVGGGNFESGDTVHALCTTAIKDTDKKTDKGQLAEGTSVYVWQKGDEYSLVVFNGNQKGYVLTAHLAK